MSEKKHSNGSLSLNPKNGRVIIDCNGRKVATTEQRNGPIAWADAEEIVRRWNCHDELVAELARLRKKLNEYMQNHVAVCYLVASDDLKSIDAVLAKAVTQ